MASQNPFLAMFARSPVGPIQEHMGVALQSVEKLSSFISAVYQQDWAEVESIRLEIAKDEAKADQLKKEIRLHLPQGLFMPVPRVDLLELVAMQDKLANKAKDIAGIMTGREMQIHAELQPLFTQYIESVISTARQAKLAIDELDELFEVGFNGKEVALTHSMIEKLDQLEDETDDIQIKVRRKLFELEKDLHPVDVMFLYRVIDWIGALADRAQRVGARLEILLAK
jgi:predicted phosphate transport protein (TIGR00153 family)|tara:strand:- start:2209 stop:2889 length:681 start_codon:yes stop_codon:yes gene_type:complete